MLPKEPWKRILVIIAYVAIGLVAAYFVKTYLLNVLLPFIVAYIIAMILHPLVNLVLRKVKLPRRLVVIFLVLGVAAALSLLCYLIVNRIYIELSSIYQNALRVLNEMNSDPEYAENIIDKINGLIPFIDYGEWLTEVWENFDYYFKTVLSSFVGNFTSIVSTLTAIINIVPSVLLGIIISVISTYYFTADYNKINAAVIGVLPKKAGDYLVTIKKQLLAACWRFVRAYGLIMLITFLEVFIGLTVLGVRYAFLIALLTAVVDLMPVLGTGTVLIPWGIIDLIAGNYFMGIGLLVLYAIITVIRQILEPKIVGKYVGLYPLLALVSMYVGLKLFGLIGLFGLPLSIVIFDRLRRDGFINIGKNKKTAPESDATAGERTVSAVGDPAPAEDAETPAESASAPAVKKLKKRNHAGKGSGKI